MVILGGGESGTGAALLATAKGYDVLLSDSGPLAERHRSELSRAGIRTEEGGHTEAEVLRADEIIKSPGIPDKAPMVVKARAAGIPVISEIEFAGRFTDVPKVCITGSNGKTTTTLLTHHVLTSGGMKAGLGGNVGKSFARLVAEGTQYDCYVLELSSFQLDGMFDFRADVAVLTNITPDHLDRYDYDFEKYADSKFRILQNQRPEDAFLFWAEDPVIAARVEKKKPAARLFPYAFNRSEAERFGEAAAYCEANQFIIHIKEPIAMSIHDLALQGKHNLLNSMAAGVAGRVFELRKEAVRESLTNFDNVEHRLEFVAKVNDITFINDSKATNVNSTWYALESQNCPVIWIAGGVDKGNDYTDLYPLLEGRVKALICLGTDNSKLKAAFEGRIGTIAEVTSAEDAVRLAYEWGMPNDVVLLSPACASFDLFENFEDRGRQFKAAVRKL
jgi:UDP-N-acetylmuramoylalanine--D-glutamate ligase